MYKQITFKFFTSEVKSWLMYAAILRATSAVGWTISVYQFMDLPYNPLVLGLVFASTLIMYNHDYLGNYSQPDDQVNMKERSEWLFKHLRQLQVLVIAAGVLSLILVMMITTALPPILASLGFALGYSVKVLPEGKSPKQISGLKAFYVASLWTVLIVWIPLAVVGSPWNSHAVLVAIACFCFVAALVNLWDIRDIEGDCLVGTMTLPVLLGESWARLVSLLLAILGGCIAVWLGSTSFFIVAVYIEILVMTYRPEIDGIFSWFNAVGIVAGLASVCV